MVKVFAFLLALALPVLAKEEDGTQAGTLLEGAVYYDSEITFEQARSFRILKEDDSLDQLVKVGHVSAATTAERPVWIITPGNNDNPAEFTFLDNPTTYWTASRYLRLDAATPTPAAPSPTPVPTKPHHRPKAESQEGKKLWHIVDGQKKWYYEKYGPHDKEKKHVTVKRAEPVNAE
jgi:hypothetical protein